VESTHIGYLTESNEIIQQQTFNEKSNTGELISNDGVEFDLDEVAIVGELDEDDWTDTIVADSTGEKLQDNGEKEMADNVPEESAFMSKEKVNPSITHNERIDESTRQYVQIPIKSTLTNNDDPLERSEKSKSRANKQNKIRDICNLLDREETDWETPVPATTFYKDKCFDSLKDFLSLWRVYCRQNFTHWRVYFVKAKEKPYQKKAESGIPDSTIMLVNLQCVHAGKRKSRSMGIRNTKISSVDCPFEIHLTYNKWHNNYEVSKFVSKHQNHDTDEAHYKSNYLYKQLTQPEMEKVGPAIIDSRMTRQELIIMVNHQTGQQWSQQNFQNMLLNKLLKSSITKKVLSKQLNNEVVPWLDSSSKHHIVINSTDSHGFLSILFWTLPEFITKVSHSGEIGLLETQPFKQEFYTIYTFLTKTESKPTKWEMVAFAVTCSDHCLNDVLSAFKRCVTTTQFTKVLTNIKKKIKLHNLVDAHTTQIDPLSKCQKLSGMYHTLLKLMNKVIQKGHRFPDLLKHVS